MHVKLLLQSVFFIIPCNISLIFCIIIILECSIKQNSVTHNSFHLCFQFIVAFLTRSFRQSQPHSIWTIWLHVSVPSGSRSCWTWAFPLQICIAAVPTTPFRFRARCWRVLWCGRRGTEERPRCNCCSRACRPWMFHHLSLNRCLCDDTLQVPFETFLYKKKIS